MLNSIDKLRFFISIGWLFFISPNVESQEFTIYKSWDFETETIDDEFTDTELASYMNMVDMINYPVKINQIVIDTINGVSTKVMRIKNLANTYYHGFGGNAKLGEDFKEIYCSFNWKFSNEFDNTSGGKMPGLIGLPMDDNMGGTNSVNPRAGYGPGPGVKVELRPGHAGDLAFALGGQQHQALLKWQES